MKKHLILAVLLIIFSGYCATTLINKDRTDKVKDIQLDAKTIDLNKLQLDTKALQVKYQTELQQKEVNQEKVKQLEVERVKLQQQLDQAQAQLQAKAKAKEDAKLAASRALNTLTGQSTASALSGGSCASWIAQAGISEVTSAMELIRRESGCNPYAVNPSSGACGVAQELPCGKSGCSLGDGACQVKWMNSYTLSRYGSWSAAVAFHNANNWY